MSKAEFKFILVSDIHHFVPCNVTVINIMQTETTI